MKKTTMFRRILKDSIVLIVPQAYDCLSARIVEAVGFKAVFMPATMTTELQLGTPAVGLATATEVVNCTRYMANSVNIPLIVGADDGYGGALAAYRTTQEVIRAGAAGIFISDRKHFILARSPHNLVEVLPRDEYIGKMSAVLEARDKEDKDFVIIARIDAGATMGDGEVLARAKSCLEIGVDMILPHALPRESKFRQRDKESLRQLYSAIGAPEVMIWGMGPSGFTAKDYEDVGAKLWVPKDPPTIAVEKALFDMYQEVYDTGNYTSQGTPSKGYSNKLRGLEFWRELEKRYVPEQS